MRVFFIFWAGILLFFNQGVAQNQFEKVIKKNFRVNPIAGSFSSFLKAFTTDPDLLNKVTIKKTDTSLFFVRGDYKVFNPFDFKVKNVVVLFAETPEKPMEDNRKMDSVKSYFSYQILAYTDDNEAFRKLIPKNYKKLAKKLKANLPKTEVTSLKGVMNVEDGEITNFYNGLSAISPATVSWQTLGQSKQLLLTLLIRMQFVDGYLVPFGFFRNTDLDEDTD